MYTVSPWVNPKVRIPFVRFLRFHFFCFEGCWGNWFEPLLKPIQIEAEAAGGMFCGTYPSDCKWTVYEVMCFLGVLTTVNNH